jgi:Leucine-rich repeat (LRR) protein
MKKKIFAIILASSMLFTITACSDENGETEFNDDSYIIENIFVNEAEETTLDPYAELDNFEKTLGYITINGEDYNTGLRRLALDHNTTNADLEQLRYMVNLEHLSIGSEDIIGRIRDITPLAELTNLTSLNLWYNPALSDISPLAGLTNLTKLNLSSWEIRDISALAELKNLTDLYIWASEVRDISILKELTNLETLTLGINLNRIDISPLAELPNLKNLTLRLLQLNDISSLMEFTNLKNLYLEKLIFFAAPESLLTAEQLTELRKALPNTEIIEIIEVGRQ